ncbi:hypothetical protein TorRG33x02_304090 [Trema orientale]|uniref:Uncharacterized protein n=1 Tax=Trema orientale TaxID=63057 RepID=A0A2P5BYN4_TREOI|nr:hypothetical protein TorRG33x02_304090 [Trema orientale]
MAPPDRDMWHTWHHQIITHGTTRLCHVVATDCTMCLLLTLPCLRCKQSHISATSDDMSATISESMSSSLSSECSHLSGTSVNITYT